MASTLNTLESKIDKVLALCEHLREENRVLHEQLHVLEGINESLTATIDTTQQRLEVLLEHLPEEA